MRKNFIFFFLLPTLSPSLLLFLEKLQIWKFYVSGSVIIPAFFRVVRRSDGSVYLKVNIIGQKVSSIVRKRFLKLEDPTPL